MVVTNGSPSLATAALGAFCVRLAAHWAAWALGSTARLISFLGGLLAASPALEGSACCTIAYNLQGRSLADSPGRCKTQACAGGQHLHMSSNHMITLHQYLCLQGSQCLASLPATAAAISVEEGGPESLKGWRTSAAQQAARVLTILHETRPELPWSCIWVNVLMHCTTHRAVAVQVERPPHPLQVTTEQVIRRPQYWPGHSAAGLSRPPGRRCWLMRHPASEGNASIHHWLRRNISSSVAGWHFPHRAQQSLTALPSTPGCGPRICGGHVKQDVADRPSREN